MLSFQKIMKRLIKRYVLKAQVDRENDEVNEGRGGHKAILLQALQRRGQAWLPPVETGVVWVLCSFWRMPGSSVQTDVFP